MDWQVLSFIYPSSATLRTQASALFLTTPLRFGCRCMSMMDCAAYPCPSPHPTPPPNTAHLLLLRGHNDLTQDAKVWLVSGQRKHDQVSVQAVHAVPGVRVPPWAPTHLAHVCHGLQARTGYGSQS